MNIYVYHMLQSCGVQARSYLKTGVKKMKIIFLALKELSWLWNLGFHFPKLDYHQWLKVRTFSIWEIRTSRRIQHVGFIAKIVCYLRKSWFRDLGSPGSRQLLQLQLFPKFLKFWNLLLISFFLGLFGLLNSIFVLLQIGIVWIWSEVNYFHAFRKTVIVCQCFGLWSLNLIWKWCPLIGMISFIVIRILFMFESKL